MTDYSPELIEAYKSVSTATLTAVLLKRGVRNVWIRGALPLGQGQQRRVGPAFTLRFIPGREDLATPEVFSSPTSSRAAIEEMPPGTVTVVEAGACEDAGILGDILTQRMRVRGVEGLVTDGVVRDLDGVMATGLPVWARGTAGPPSIAGLCFAGWQQPIGCGGVPVFPGDLISADRDGAVVIPAKLAHDMLDQCLEQEALEAWIIDEVRNGVSLPGLYPPDDEAMQRYRKFKKA